MENKRQFSLAYLFLETFWIAATLGCACEAYRVCYRYYYLSDYETWSSAEAQAVFQFLILGALLCCGTAIGGLFKRMRVGAAVVYLVVVGIAVILGLLPAVQ